MKKLKGLCWEPMWVTHLGCIKGCLDYLGIEMTDDWLFGGSGHAFVLNIHEVVCPSGPTAWITEMLFRLSENLGYTQDVVFSKRSMPDFDEAPQKAWEFVRKNLDGGIPCYGWELAIPEFYVIYGYDDTGYHFSGPLDDQGPMPKPWEHLGDTGISIIEVYSVSETYRADDIETVRSALESALEHARGPEKWIFPKYSSGLAGYDTWIRSLEEGTADGHGMAYNTAVWHECREHARSFLVEAAQRLGGRYSGRFTDAISCYGRVADLLGEVEELFPMKGILPDHIEDADRRSKAAALLADARDAESEGMNGLAGIIDILSV